MTNDANWVGGAAPTDTNTAVWVFGSSSNTILTNGFTSYMVNGIVFTADATNSTTGTNYTIASAGNAFTLNGGITNQSATNQAINTGLTINSAIVITNTADSSSAFVSLGGALTGSGTITYGAANSAGRLQFSGNNTNFSGAVVANSGRVVFLGTNASSLNTDYTFTNGTGDGVRLGNVSGVYNFGSLSGTARISANATNISVTLAAGHQGSNTTYSGVIASNNLGAGQTFGLTKMGSGTLTLTAANTYNGATIISNGVLQIGEGGAAGSISNSTSITLAGGSLAINRSDLVTQGGNFTGTVISGAGGFIQMGSGTTTLAAANTYSGDTLISAGVLLLSNSSAVQSSVVNLAGGALLFDSALTTATMGGLKGSGGLVLTNGAGSALALTLSNAAGAAATNTGVISGTGSLTLVGSGTQTLSGANTYSGTTTISNGVLQLGAGGTAGSIANTASITVAGGSLAINRSDDVTQGTDFSGAALTGSGGFIQMGAGTTTLTAANTFSGATVVSAGALRIGHGGTTGSLSASSTITNHGILIFDRSDGIAQGTDFGAAAIVGTGSLVKRGAGTLTLNAANTFSGGTLLEAGVIALGTNHVLGSGTLTMSGGTALVAVGAGRSLSNNLAIAGNVIFNGAGFGSALSGNVDLGGATRTLTLNNSTTFNGIISNGSVVLDANASFRSFQLGASNSFADITVERGVIQLTGSGSLSSTSAVSLAPSVATSTLDISGISAASTTIGSLSGTSSNALVNLGSKQLIVGGNNASTTFAGIISNTGSLGKIGSGTLTITGTNTYTGATTVSGGKLTVNGSIADSAVTVQSGAVLSGSGTVGATTIDSGATIAPGNSPGTQSINGDLTWNGGGNYDWEIFNLAGPAGTGWDVIDVSDQLLLGNLSSENKFNINIFSLSGINPDVLGPLAGWDPAVTNSWTIVRTTNGITSFDAANFNINASGFTSYNSIGSGLFSLALDGNDLKLVFSTGATPIPEPGTWAAGALLAIGAGLAARRRFRKDGPAGGLHPPDAP